MLFSGIDTKFYIDDIAFKPVSSAGKTQYTTAVLAFCASGNFSFNVTVYYSS
jgi:hypothetical protein